MNRSGVARNHQHQPQEDEEDYIDMDISSMADFEFHLSTTTAEKEPTTSPADELFHGGKLLPLHLHLPPRMEMVLENRTTQHHRRRRSGEGEREVSEEIPIPPTTAFTGTGSRSVGGGLTGLEDLLDTKRRRASKKKLSYLGHKLKASTAYLRSLLFLKSTRSCEPRESASGRKNSFWPTRGERGLTGKERSVSSHHHHRKSFSGAINNHMQPKSSQSSSSSSSCSPSSLMPMLERSASAKSDGEDSIQGAIAYCKKSLIAGRKSASDVGTCSFSVARIVVTCEEMDRPSFSRG